MNPIEPCTVLVVEDELPILNNVVRKLEELKLPLRVVATSSNGQEAIAAVERCMPQIVVTDIRMPGMDGLELCRHLYEQHPEIKKVVLSGYSEFEYAQAAIRYHVSDYLLKPVNSQKLLTIMERLCGDLAESRRVMQRQCLTRQLSGGGATGELPYQFEEGAFGLHLICLGNLLDRVLDDNPNRFAALWETAALDEFMDNQDLDCWWLIEEHNPNERMLLSAGHAPKLAERLYAHLRARLGEQCSVNLHEAGSEVTFNEVWSFARQLREELRQALVPCSDGLFVLGTAVSQQDAAKSFRLTLETVSHDCAPGALRAALHTGLRELRTKGIAQGQLESAIQELLPLLEEPAPENSGEIKRLYRNCCREIAEATDADKLYARLEELLFDAFGKLNCSVPAEGLAAAVKSYIDKHYSEEITMELLAEQFHFSQSYITRLFRAQYDAPPVKYILTRRIERAKELIAGNSTLSFGTVAELVGYPDQHYFSRLFRISTGMSPSEYRLASEANNS